jgi:hypothetical protein
MQFWEASFSVQCRFGPTCSFVRYAESRRVPVTPPITLNRQGLQADKRPSGPPYHCRCLPCLLMCRLARAAVCAGVNYGLIIRTASWPLRRTAGGSRRISPRFGTQDSSGPPCRVPRDSRHSLRRRRLSSGSLSNCPRKLASPGACANVIVSSGVAVAYLRFHAQRL